MIMNFLRFLGMNTWVVPFLSMIMILCHISEESSLVLTVKDNVYTCITDSISALVNNQTDNNSRFQHDDYDNFNCDISGDESSCNQKWTPENQSSESDESDTGGSWEIASSIESKIDQLILDYRWEKFLTKNLTQRTPEKLVSVEEDGLVIPMSIRTNYDIDLHLCDDLNICFRFKLMSNATILEKCYDNFESCKEVLKNNHTEGLSNLRSSHWNHYILTKRNNKVTLFSEKEKIILEYDNPINFLNTSRHYSLFGSAQQGEAYVKIHSYEFVKTEQAANSSQFGSDIKSSDGFYCISMFILTSANCSLNFKFDNSIHSIIQNDSHETNRSSTKPYRWKYEKIYFKSNSTELKLIISTMGEEKGIWAIDSVRKCQLDEVRTLSYNEATSCETLIDRNHVELMNKTNLIDHLNISNWNRTLREEITSNSTVCVSGYCYCRYGYYGDLCLENIRPSIYRDPPVVISHNTSCTMTQETNLSQSGPVPSKYLVQYKNRNSKDWITHKKGDLTKGQKYIEETIKNLRSNELYEIRIVPYGSKFEEDQLINHTQRKSYNCTPTSCSEPSTKNLTSILPSVESTKDSALITFPIGKKYCGVEVKISIRCSSDWCRRNETIKKHTTSIEGLTITSLQPYSNYILYYQLGHLHNKTFLFRTNATVSEPISELGIISRGSNYISMRWRPPYPPTGNVTSYKFHNAETRDVLLENKVEVCRLWKEYHCANLTNLSRNKNYTIQVGAINSGQNESIFENINCTTAESASERPIDLKLEWNDNRLTLFWKHPNNTNGELTSFIMKLTPKTGKEIQREYQLRSEDDYKLDYEYEIPSELEPCTDYEIEVIANNSIIGEPAKLNETSPPTVPNITIKAVDVTKTSLSVEISSINHVQNKTNENLHLFFIVSNDKFIFWNDMKINISASSYKRLHNNFTLAAYRSYKGVKINSDSIDLRTSSDPTTNVDLKPYEAVRKDIVCVNNQGLILLAVNEYGGKYRSQKICVKPIDQAFDEMKLHNYWLFWMSIFTILTLLGVTSLLCYKKKKNIYARARKSIRGGTKYNNNVPSIHRIKFLYIGEDEILFPSHVNPKRTSTTPDIVNEMINENSKMAFSNIIEVSDLEEYVKKTSENGTLAREHELFQCEPSSSLLCTISEANNLKNRYKNIIPYDYNRVILRNRFGTETDYINASYIDGFEVPKAYIATQGPTKNTIDDFWLMIWQQNVHHIVMMANLEENGQEKVSKYWPEQDESRTHYDILIRVDNVSIHERLNYIKRIFMVTCNTEQREVTQYQFTDWPDHTVPSSTNSVIAFMIQLQTIALSTSSPVVVHCSAGTGRTGTIIVCDINLRRAAKTKAVDFKNVLHNLRQERSNMVGMVEQYIFAHRLVADYLTTIDTAVRLS